MRLYRVNLAVPSGQTFRSSHHASGQFFNQTLLAKDSDHRFLWDASIDASVLKFCAWLENFRRWLNVLRNWRAEAFMNLSIRSERN